MEGFLTDFEFASLPHKDRKEVVEWVEKEDAPDHHRGNPTRTKLLVPHYMTVPNAKTAGDPITGTVLFMATSLLREISNPAGITVVRTPQHDVESFLWVFIYVVYKHGVDNLDESKDAALYKCLVRDFDRLFSSPSIPDLIEARLCLHDGESEGRLGKYAYAYGGKHFRALVAICWRLLRDLLQLYPDTEMDEGGEELEDLIEIFKIKRDSDIALTPLQPAMGKTSLIDHRSVLQPFLFFLNGWKQAATQ